MNFVPDATHDFVDVEDVITGLLTLSKIKATGIHEFGNGIAIENEEVLRLVEEVTGRKANIRKTEKLRDYDSPDWYCKSMCAYWQPTKSLRQSITEMVAQYRNEHA